MAGAQAEWREHTPRQPLRSSSGLRLDLWVAPGEAVMQAKREIQVHHHLSGLDLVWGFIHDRGLD